MAEQKKRWEIPAEEVIKEALIPYLRGVTLYQCLDMRSLLFRVFG